MNGNQKHSIANCVAIDFFLGCHTSLDFNGLIDDGLISTIDLVTKFGLA
jgi:hypothetical protein